MDDIITLYITHIQGTISDLDTNGLASESILLSLLCTDIAYFCSCSVAVHRLTIIMQGTHVEVHLFKDFCAQFKQQKWIATLKCFIVVLFVLSYISAEVVLFASNKFQWIVVLIIPLYRSTKTWLKTRTLFSHKWKQNNKAFTGSFLYQTTGKPSVCTICTCGL